MIISRSALCPEWATYTAAAVASIAFRLPHAAVDGNVLRVIARLANDASEISSAGVRARLGELAAQLLDPRDPGLFNQAMMELGAIVCIPRRARCGECPVVAFCDAGREGTQDQLPVKRARGAPKAVEMTLALVERSGRVLMFRRQDGARRMAGFWELPEPGQAPGFRETTAVGVIRHTITDTGYRIQVVRGTLARAPRGFRWLNRADRAALPVSTIARKALALASRAAANE